MNGSGDPSRRGRRRQGSPTAGGTFDQWMVAGRQLVNGVSGARPGSRAQARGAGGRAGARPGLDGLGRWVGERFDWFLEGDDDWPEPWQERPSPQEREAQAPPARRSSGFPADEPFRAGSREPFGRSALGRTPEPASEWNRSREIGREPGSGRDPRLDGASERRGGATASAARSSGPAPAPARSATSGSPGSGSPSYGGNTSPGSRGSGSSGHADNTSTGAGSPGSGGRRALEAISRRSAPLLPPAASDTDDWPEDDNFRLPRWQRPSGAAGGGEPPRSLPPAAAAPSPPAAPPASAGPAPARTPQRPLPRSSRRRD